MAFHREAISLAGLYSTLKLARAPLAHLGADFPKAESGGLP